jgi:hypothetical protein
MPQPTRGGRPAEDVPELEAGAAEEFASTKLGATLLFRGLSYWLPMAPGILLARRETRT